MEHRFPRMPASERPSVGVPRGNMSLPLVGTCRGPKAKAEGKVSLRDHGAQSTAVEASDHGPTSRPVDTTLMDNLMRKALQASDRRPRNQGISGGPGAPQWCPAQSARPQTRSPCRTFGGSPQTGFQAPVQQVLWFPCTVMPITNGCNEAHSGMLVLLFFPAASTGVGGMLRRGQATQPSVRLA